MTDMLDLLGGAKRVRTRVRGFAPWSPKEETLHLIGQVREVLREYAPYLPLTLRQIFYRLVGAHDYEKTEQGYERLGEHLNRARRARMIPMSAIRDDGTTSIKQFSYSGASGFIDSVRYRAAKMELDHSAGQQTRLIVSCEHRTRSPAIGWIQRRPRRRTTALSPARRVRPKRLHPTISRPSSAKPSSGASIKPCSTACSGAKSVNGQSCADSWTA